MPKNQKNKQKKKEMGNKTTQNKTAPPKTDKVIAKPAHKPVAVVESGKSLSPSVEETRSIPQEEISQDNIQSNEEVAEFVDNTDATLVEENDAWFENKPTSLSTPVSKNSKGNRKKPKNESQGKTTETTASATSEADGTENNNRKHEDISGRNNDNERKSNKRQGGEVSDKNKQKRDDKSKECQGSGRNDPEESSKYENNQNQKFSNKNKQRSTNVDESRSSYRAEDTNTQQESWRRRSNKDYGNWSKGEAYSFNNRQGSSSWGNNDRPKEMNPYRSEDDKSPWSDQPLKRGKNRDGSPNKRQEFRWDEQSKGANTRWDTPNRNHQSNEEDSEYKKFDYNYRKLFINYVKVQEIDGDLFAMSNEYSLAHCVAEDLNMGSGIAVQFSQQFKRRDELYQQRQRQGGLAILDDKERYIYYLITKRLSNGKPTYQTLWSSLKKLQQHIEQNEVKKLAIPRIGCGLDRLEWSTVKHMLEFIFKNTNVEITVCNFQQNHGKTKQKLKQKSDTEKKGKQLKIDQMCTKKTKRKK